MLTIVALPIGNIDDITVRALNALKTADVIVGEERRVLLPLLKRYGVDVQTKQIEFLNEHSRPEEIQEIKKYCREKNVSLVSDCGTPVFCDPGALLIEACRKENILVKSVPGASSLMMILSLSSKPIKKFYFAGFLPRDKEERIQEIQRLSKIQDAIVVMDTPYRLKLTLEQLAQSMPNRKAILGCDLTTEIELVLEDTLTKIKSKIMDDEKREFILLIYGL